MTRDLTIRDRGGDQRVAGVSVKYASSHEYPSRIIASRGRVQSPNLRGGIAISSLPFVLLPARLKMRQTE